ncbi:MAG: hypothetical protein QNK04_25735 [Myxococcota bacterium]|nr:hypothetical protein [Myxococcota bacterium]
MSAPPRDPSAPATAPSAETPAAPPGLAGLRRRETELEAEWQRLQAAGHGFRELRSQLADPRTPEEDAAKLLREADAAQRAFLDRLDAFQRELQAHFLQQVENELARATRTMNAFYGRRRMRSLLRQQRRLEHQAARARELESAYGTAEDHKRIAAVQRFYAGVVAFSARIRALDPTMPPPAPRSLVERLYALQRGLIWGVTRLPKLLRLVAIFLRAVWIACSKKASSGGTPFTNRVDDLFRTWGEVRGLAIEVTGQTLPSREGNEITLYTPAHRHGVTDNVAFSHLRLPDYLVFNAVDQLPLLPRFLKDRIATTDGLIAVGGGRGPSVDRALEALSRGVSRNVLIYPEGSVSSGFRGTRPPRANFGDGLVRRIREAGYRLRIVPVTYLDNARFLDLPPRSATAEERRRRVTVSAGLESPMIDALLAAGGGGMVGRMVRLAWLEELVTDESLLLGQDRVAAIEKRLDLELDGIRYWGSLESMPVGDRLRFETDEPLAVREEPFLGKRVRVIHVPESARDERGRIPVLDLAGGDSKELLIGIRAPSHIYLNVGRQRFDGDIFRTLAVKEREFVYPGIVLRFTGIPIKSLNAIQRKLEEYAGRETRTLTCANSACRVIARAANIRIDDHADMRPFLPSHVLPTRTIRKLIERGVRNHIGESVGYQIYNTDGRPLEELLEEARREELRIARDHARILTVGAWRTLVRGLRRALSSLRRRPED